MIEFKNVNFSYENGIQILKDINLKIEEGETIGLIGCNGAGKSTLMKVLLGLLPHEGTINVGDLELNKKNLEEVRRKLGFVLQDSDNQMFMPTVYEDMMFGPLNYGHSKEEASSSFLFVSVLTSPLVWTSVVAFLNISSYFSLASFNFARITIISLYVF